jgi:hypothetical protein
MKEELSREELYERVWSAPATEVAAQLGISDVALAKRCKKLNVPKPPLGYWARIAAGQKPKKAPLPPSAAEAFAKAAEQPVPKTLSLPNEIGDLHPLAKELMQALNAKKADSQKQFCLRERTLPEISLATKSLNDRAAKAFHIILNGVEPLGIVFRRALSAYDSGYFQKGQDRLYLKIEEIMVDQPPGSTRRPAWSAIPTAKEGAGLLSFSLAPERYASREAKRWKEEKALPLEELLPQVILEVRRFYVAAQKQRAEEAMERERQRVESERRWREHQEKEAIRLAEERKERHAEALETVAQTRAADLLKAAEWSRLHRAVLEFISECEARWREASSGELNGEQQRWLSWARETAKGMSPADFGYPDPLRDGPFDPAAVPLGGPYPATHDLPQPPTMPRIPAAPQQSAAFSDGSVPVPKPQFPFWLKYPRR